MVNMFRGSASSPFKTRALGVFFCSIIAVATRTNADSPAAPTDSLHLSRNGQFELVLLPKARFARKNPVLRKRYSQSGLYRKGAPSRALWTVDWFAWNVYPASDGHHLVRMGPWASSEEDLAVAFYRDGRLLRQWKINQLVKDPQSLPHSVSHFEWRKSISFNDAKRLLRVTTLGGEKYLFDAKGQMLEGRPVPPYQPKSLADGFLRKGDVQGLIRLGSVALPEIAQAVRSGKGQTQQVGLLALCANGKAALPELEQLSRDSRVEMRVLAATALQEISAPESKPILEAMLQDKVAQVRIEAIAALVQVHQEAKESAAIQAATDILRTGSDAEKRDLLFALRDFRVPALIPEVLPLLKSSGRSPDSANSLAERANYWLSGATFQNFDYIDQGSEAQQKLSKAWQSWWLANRERSPDQWFAQAVERDITFLSKAGFQRAPNHLEQLTGQSFGREPGSSNSKAISQWNAWWQNNKGRRPGQVLISSLLTSKDKEFSSGDALGQLVLQCDACDVADLVALYASYVSGSTSRSWERNFVEIALRRITNIDSFGVTLVGGSKEQAAIEAWKQCVP